MWNKINNLFNKSAPPVAAKPKTVVPANFWGKLAEQFGTDKSAFSNKQELIRHLQFRGAQVITHENKVEYAKKVIERFGIDQSGEQTRMAFDAVNPNTIPYNSFYFNNANSILIDNFFVGYAELSLITQNGMLNNIATTLANEMTSKWIEFVGVGEETVDAKEILELEKEFERLGVKKVFNRAAWMTFVFGGCLLYPKLKHDEDYLQEELIIDNAMIGKGDLEYINVIEPIWYVPIQYNTMNPFSKYFYVPEYYSVLEKVTHCSRVFKFIHNEAPNILKPTYLFNGIPLIQQLMPYVMKWENTANQIVKIIARYNTSVLKTNLEAIIDDTLTNDEETSISNLSNRIKAFNIMRDNGGVFALDADTEDFAQITMTLTGLAELWSQQGEYICAIAKTPATKLFGTSAPGLNATGEHEMKNFYDLILSYQECIFRDNLIKVKHLAMLNIWGEIKNHITFRFANLEQANELEESTIRLNEAQRDDIYVKNTVIAPHDVAKKLMRDADSGYDALDVSERDYANEEEEQYGETPDNLNEAVGKK